MSHEHLELVRRALGGDSHAERQVYEICWRAIVGAVYRCGPLSAEERADVMQTAWSNLEQALPRYQGDSSLQRYAWRIAQKSFLQVVRDTWHRRVDLVDPLEPSAPLVASATTGDAEALLGDHELIEKLKKKLQSRLTPTERIVFRLLFNHELSPAEIMKATGKSRTHVDKMSSEIRKKARRLVRELLELPKPDDDEGGTGWVVNTLA